MHHPYTKHTIDIFARMYEKMPPMVPAEIVGEVKHALEHLRDDFTVSSNDVEDVVIALGKKVWPYWRAFAEFYDLYQGKLGEKFLLGKLPVGLRTKYKELKEQGVTYHDLRVGTPLENFNSDEKVLLRAGYIEVDNEIRQHVEQAILSVERRKYEELVVDFQNILDNMEKRLETLRLMAEDEEEHPAVAEEIRGQVKAFELGLCLLGPNIAQHEVLNVDDYLEERRLTKKVHRL